MDVATFVGRAAVATGVPVYVVAMILADMTSMTEELRIHLNKIEELYGYER